VAQAQRVDIGKSDLHRRSCYAVLLAGRAVIFLSCLTSLSAWLIRGSSYIKSRECDKQRPTELHSPQLLEYETWPQVFRKIECFPDFLMKRYERDRRGAPGCAASVQSVFHKPGPVQGETALGGTWGECGVGLVDSARVSRCVSICFKTAGSSMAAMIDEKFT
jgi:hypothetical protein